MSGKKTTRQARRRVSAPLERIGRALDRIVGLGESALKILQQSCEANSEQQTCSVDPENGTPLDTIELSTEDVISFAEASELIPTHPSPSTISRWCKTGARGTKLDSINIGGRRRTTRQAVERFLRACSERDFVGMEGNIGLLRKHVEATRSKSNGNHDY